MLARTPGHPERLLRRIEADLEGSVPRLAVMFAIFARLTAGERPTGPERLLAPGRLPPWPGRPARWAAARRARRWLARAGHGLGRRPALVAIVMFVAVIGTAIGFAANAPAIARQCPPRASASAPATTGAPAGCPVYITRK
ncbi:MAG TPA: hypothetical protein VH478_22465 [Trebonia sp.]|jgi:hypothetical protein|nr:hypothetical protein [Trebonia sp.]